MSHGTVAAPKLPREILLPLLAEFCIPRILSKILRKDAIFLQIELRCGQIADVRDIAELQHNSPLSLTALAKAFESSTYEVV
jgi:hypothetical protein